MTTAARDMGAFLPPLKIDVSELSSPAEKYRIAGWGMDPSGSLLVTWADGGSGEAVAGAPQGKAIAASDASRATTPLTGGAGAGGLWLCASVRDVRTKAWTPPVAVAASGGAEGELVSLEVSAAGAGRWLILWVSQDKGGKRTAHAAASTDAAVSWKVAPLAVKTAGIGVGSDIGTATVLSGAAPDTEPWLIAWTTPASGRASAPGALWTAAWTSTVGVSQSERVLANAAVRGALSGVRFREGTLLLSYRGYNDDGAVDPWQVARREDRWQDAVRLGREGWLDTPPETPGAVLSAAGPYVGAVWYTASDDEPRICVTASPDAGKRWMNAQRADLRTPTGPVAGLVRRDGSHLVAWTEAPGEDESQPGGIYLRRYNPMSGTIAPTRLFRWVDVDRSGALSLRAMEAPDSGGRVRAVLGFFAPGGGLRLAVLTLPPQAELEEIDRECGCSARAGAMGEEGTAIRGRILEVDTKGARLRVEHEAVPGLLRRGELTARVTPAVAGAVTAGRGFLGRLRERPDGWWLDEVRLFALPGK